MADRRRRRNVWAVVEVMDGVPVHVEGPYDSRAEARGARRALIEDDAANGGIDLVETYVVTKMTRVMTPAEVERMKSGLFVW